MNRIPSPGGTWPSLLCCGAAPPLRPPPPRRRACWAATGGAQFRSPTCRSPAPCGQRDRVGVRSARLDGRRRRAGGGDARAAAGPRHRLSTSHRACATATASMFATSRTFTGEGNPIGIGRVLWAELRTAARGHRRHPSLPHRARRRSSASSVERPAAADAGRDQACRSGRHRVLGLRAARRSVRPATSWPAAAQPGGGRWSWVPCAGQGCPGRPGLAGQGHAGAAAKAPVRPQGGPPPQPGPFTNPSTPSASAAAGLAAAPATPPRGCASTGRAALMMHARGDRPRGRPGHADPGCGRWRRDGAELKGGYGNWIEIEHDGPASVFILHGINRPTKLIDRLRPYVGLCRVAPASMSSRASVIGYVGTTGRSTGPHLHFEILSNGKPTNPMISPDAPAPTSCKRRRTSMRFKKVIDARAAASASARRARSRRRLRRLRPLRGRTPLRAPAPAGGGRRGKPGDADREPPPTPSTPLDEHRIEQLEGKREHCEDQCDDGACDARRRTVRAREPGRLAAQHDEAHCLQQIGQHGARHRHVEQHALDRRGALIAPCRTTAQT